LSTDLARTQRPRRRSDITAFPVANELVLLPPEGSHAYALNESGAAIWKVCDGTHTLPAMLEELRAQYSGEDLDVLADVAAALLAFRNFNLIETAVATRPGRPDSATSVLAPAMHDSVRVRFVFGVEDSVYFHWQLAILFESLVGQLPPGWDITVVVCNDHVALSSDLTRLLNVYGVHAVTGVNHRKSHDVDFSEGRGGHVALNRVEALNVIAAYVEVDDVVCLMDTDIFLYGDLLEDLFPSGNALARNAMIGEQPFMSGVAGGRGIDLNKVLAAIGCETPLKPGGVTVFLTGQTVRHKKVIRDCFRCAQILFLLGKVLDLPPQATWLAEMACFAMALTPNGIDYELLEAPQFAVLPPEPETVAQGSFYHYYCDINDGAGGPFRGSEWHKQLFRDSDLLLGDLESFRARASSDLERRFFDFALAARHRLHGRHAAARKAS
jgi:hypothetical protein